MGYYLKWLVSPILEGKGDGAQVHPRLFSGVGMAPFYLLIELASRFMTRIPRTSAPYTGVHLQSGVNVLNGIGIHYFIFFHVEIVLCLFA